MRKTIKQRIVGNVAKTKLKWRLKVSEIFFCKLCVLKMVILQVFKHAFCSPHNTLSTVEKFRFILWLLYFNIFAFYIWFKPILVQICNALEICCSLVHLLSLDNMWKVRIGRRWSQNKVHNSTFISFIIRVYMPTVPLLFKGVPMLWLGLVLD